MALPSMQVLNSHNCSFSDIFQVLETGQEIMELDQSGFATHTTTIHAANIGDNNYIIQVTPMGIKLMEGGDIFIADLY